MESNIKVSVMVLAYNHEKYIRKALESMVSQQTNFKFEIVIGEDKSTDNTRAIIREYYERYPDIIKPLFRKKNLGATRNVAATLRKCTGEYVAFMECDDFWTDPLKLQKQADFLDSHPDYAGVMCNTLAVNRYDKPMVTGPKVLNHELLTALDYAKTMYPYNEFKFIGAFMARNYYANGVNDKYLLQTQYVDDFIVEGLAMREGKIGFLDEHMAAYRWVPSHGNNFSALNKEILCRDRIKSIRILLDLFGPETYPRIYMRICRDHWIMLYTYKGKKEYLNQIKYFLYEMTICEKLFYIVYWIKRKTTGVF